MIAHRLSIWIAVALVLVLTLTACGQAASTPAATSTPATQTSAATSAPTTAVAPSPTAVPKPIAAATATSKPAASVAAASPTAKPAATTQAANSAIADLLAKSKGLGEYSYDFKMSISSMEMKGKAYVKGSKMRQEMDLTGLGQTVLITDLEAKATYMFSPGSTAVTKMDIGSTAAAGSSQTPGDQIAALPADSKMLGTETVDGKPTTIVEAKVSGTTQKIWIWTEKGVPLKFEMGTGSGRVTGEFSSYQFTSQPDSLFQLPAGAQVQEMKKP